MADGSELTEHYQYGFRDLVFGANTPYTTTKVDGLLSMPDVTVSDSERQNEHGSEPGSILMQKRKIAFDMSIHGSVGDDIEGKLAIARRTFQVPRKRYVRTLEPFTFWRPGEPKKMCLVRCTRRDFTSEYKTARGLAEGSVELEAPFPLIVSTQQKTETVTIIDTESVGEVTFFQEGDYSDGAWPIIRINGPCTDPIITNAEDDGRAIRLDVVLANGEYVDIDVDREVAWVNDVRDSTIFRSDNEWWSILPGYNTISYNRTGSTDESTATITYRDTWQ